MQGFFSLYDYIYIYIYRGCVGIRARVFRVNERFLTCSQGCVSTRYDKVVLLLVNADLVCGDILAVTGPHALIYALMDGRPDTSIPLTSRCPKPSLTSCNNEVVPSSDMFDV